MSDQSTLDNPATPPAQASSQQTATPLPAWRQWIIDHDDSWLFMIAYIGLAVVLSIWISLFWLVVVVSVHGLFEWMRQRHVHPQVGGIVERVLWELKLDIALVIFALVIEAYMEVMLGVAGLGGAARLGAQAAPRTGAWARILRGVLLSIDDAAQAGRVLLSRRGDGDGGDDADPTAPSAMHRRRPANPWRGRWSIGDHVSVGLGVLGLSLILLTPLLTDHSYPSMLSTFAQALHPMPGDS